MYIIHFKSVGSVHKTWDFTAKRKQLYTSKKKKNLHAVLQVLWLSTCSGCCAVQSLWTGQCWHFIKEETEGGEIKFFLKTSCPGSRYVLAQERFVTMW